MASVASLVPLSALRQDAARVLREMRSSNELVFITQRGRARAVLMSIAAFERSVSERDILLLLTRGEKEIASGLGHDLDSGLGEADTLVAEE